LTYMNLGLGGRLSFSSLGSGVREMNVPSGAGYLPSGYSTTDTLGAISSTQTIGGNNYKVIENLTTGNLELLNLTASSRTAITSLATFGGNVARLDFGSVGPTLAATFIFVATGNGQLYEVSYATAAITQSMGLGLASGSHSLTGFYFNQGSWGFTQYDGIDTLLLAGTMQGYSAIPEPATSVALAGMAGLIAAACWRRRRAGNHRPSQGRPQA
jgi:hypothetical protein